MAIRSKKTRQRTPKLSLVAGADIASNLPLARPKRRLARRRAAVVRSPGLVLSGARAFTVTAAESDVTDEIKKGGPAFGSFLESVGLAVAESQAKLDETLKSTAKTLSETQIDVVAVFEQVVNDADGSMDRGEAKIQKLPLINYLMPTAYNFSRVFLQADMKVSEFNGANGFNIQGKTQNFSASANANYGFLGFGVSGGMSYGQSNYSSSTDSSVSMDSAAGTLHMEATLEPRTNIELPKPIILQKGPKLALRIISTADITGTASGTGPAPIVGRKATIEAKLLSTAGAGLSGKDLAVTVSDPALGLEVGSATDRRTGSAGTVSVVISNEWGSGTTPPARRDVVVAVRFGLVSQTIGVSL